MSNKAKDGIAITWFDDVEQTNYSSAESYLSLLYGVTEVTRLIARLRSEKVVQFKAKDIFRASQLSLLRTKNRDILLFLNHK